MKQFVADLGKRFLHLFPHFKLLQTYLYSPTDAVAENVSFAETEAYFARSRHAPRLAAALTRFFDDPEADRCLRKEFLCVLERRLRAAATSVDPAEAHGYGHVDNGGLGHPLDPEAGAILSRSTGRPITVPHRSGMAVLAVLSLIAWCAAAIAAATWIGIRHGRPRVRTVTAPVSGRFFITESTMAEFAAVCRERGADPRDVFVFWHEREVPKSDLYSVIVDRALPVPRRAWFAQVAWPMWRLAATCLATGLGAVRDPFDLELATRTINLAATAIPIWRRAFTLRPQWVFDTMDYSAAHNVSAMVFRRFGARLIRYPATETEGPGLSYRYLDFAVFAAGGTYHFDTYGKSWNPNCVPLPIGIPRNDEAFNRDVGERTHQGPYKAIRDYLAAGRKMAVFFANNEIPGFNDAALTLLAVTWEEIRGNDGWFLAIKPKKAPRKGGFFDRIQSDPRTAGIVDSDQVVVTDFPQSKFGEVEPPTWLIDRMAFGLTLPSTVQAESLTRGRPALAFFPVIQDTPLTLRLKRQGLMHTDVDGLRATIRGMLDGTAPVAVDIDEAKAIWDPFTDGLATRRLGAFLLDGIGVEAKREADSTPS